MKKTLLLAFALILSAATFAQQQLATLNHHNETTDEDEITVYYGQNALYDAHTAAVNGDIITLSPGTFNSVNITKAVTIRGAGMFADVDAGTGATTLINNYTITVAQNENYRLYMEGIYNACQKVYYATVYNPSFVKCFFRDIEYSNNNNSVMRDAEFSHCIIQHFKGDYDNRSLAQHTQFVNSAILDIENPQVNSNIHLQHCVAQLYSYPTYLNRVSVVNSIVYYGWCNSVEVNAYNSYSSIGIQTGNCTYNYFNFSGLSDHNLYNYKGYSSVFKNFQGSYSAGITFELLDEVAATRLGTDGTQIGMYGGATPFDPKVRNPLIGKVTVAPTTTSAGKLEVDIQLNEPTNNTNTNTDPNN